MAEKRETYISEFDKVERAIREVELLDDPDTELNARLQDLRELLKQRGSELDPRAKQELTNQIERE